jgi:hypothetical protein
MNLTFSISILFNVDLRAEKMCYTESCFDGIARDMNILQFQIMFPFSPLKKCSVTLRLAIYRQSVRLGDKPLETHDQ